MESLGKLRRVVRKGRNTVGFMLENEFLTIPSPVIIFGWDFSVLLGFLDAPLLCTKQWVCAVLDHKYELAAVFMMSMEVFRFK